MGTDRVEVERTPLSEPKFVESTHRCLQNTQITYQVTEYHGTDPGYGPELALGIAVVGGAVAVLIWQPESWYYVSGAAGYGAYLLMPREGESWTEEYRETNHEVVEHDIDLCKPPPSSEATKATIPRERSE